MILEPNVAAKYCVIWMHGLGASNQDMYGLAQGLSMSDVPCRHVSLQAPDRPVTINQNMVMPAWYDIVGQSLTDREDKEGIVASEKLIIDAIEAQEAQGISTKNIFLAGFSQGGAMALHTGLKYSQYLAGVISLSAYLPLASEFEPAQRKTLPIFMAYGANDQVVFPMWTEQSKAKLAESGFKRIVSHQYPMMHEVCLDEMRDLRQWLFKVMS